jgi:hypothetical protein
MPASSNSPIAREEFCEGTVQVLALIQIDDTAAEYIQDRLNEPKRGRAITASTDAQWKYLYIPYDVSVLTMARCNPDASPDH